MRDSTVATTVRCEASTIPGRTPPWTTKTWWRVMRAPWATCTRRWIPMQRLDYEQRRSARGGLAAAERHRRRPTAPASMAITAALSATEKWVRVVCGNQAAATGGTALNG